MVLPCVRPEDAQVSGRDAAIICVKAWVIAELIMSAQRAMAAC